MTGSMILKKVWLLHGTQCSATAHQWHDSRFPTKQLFKCNDTMIIENRKHRTLKIIFIWHVETMSVCSSICDLVWLNGQIFMEFNTGVLIESCSARASFLKTDSVTTFLYFWLWMNFHLHFPHCRNYWVKFATKILNVMPLSNCEL